MTERLKGVMLLLPLIVVLFIGGPAINIAAYILSIVGLKELHSAFNKSESTKLTYLVSVVVSTILIFKEFLNINEQTIISLLFLSFIMCTVLVIFNKCNVSDLAVAFFGVIYITIPFTCIIYIYNHSPISPNIAWTIFLIAFSSDTFAYITGKKFGKNKLIPQISPNKTVEGSLGGILGAMLIITLYCMFFDLELKILVPIAALGSVLAQLGDLFASAIKRQNNIKDFGDLIPGHGGIIDRFDSILFVAPLILCIMVTLLIQ